MTRIPKTERTRHKAGKRINHFVILEYYGNSRWRCKCDCGKEFIQHTHHIKRRQSCGCLSKSSRFARKFNWVENAWQRRFRRYRDNAKRRKLAFELSINDVISIISKPCLYCKQTPHNLGSYTLLKDIDIEKWKNIFTSGIDRLDNSIGYTKENSVPCCQICNRAKGNLTISDFKNWIRLISQNFNFVNTIQKS